MNVPDDESDNKIMAVKVTIDKTLTQLLTGTIGNTSKSGRSYTMTQKGIQYTDTYHSHDLIERHYLVFKPTLKEFPCYKLLNEITGFSLDLEKMSMTLLYIETTDKIFDFLKEKHIEKYAKKIIPENAGYFPENEKCFFDERDLRKVSDIYQLEIADHFIRKLGNTFAIMYQSTYFIETYIDLLRKYVINKVMYFLKKLLPDSYDKLHLEQREKKVSITYQAKPNLKVILFRCKLGNYIPHITLNYVSETHIDEEGMIEVARNRKMVSKFKKQKLNLLNGQFMFY